MKILAFIIFCLPIVGLFILEAKQRGIQTTLAGCILTAIVTLVFVSWICLGVYLIT